MEIVPIYGFTAIIAVEVVAIFRFTDVTAREVAAIYRTYITEGEIVAIHFVYRFTDIYSKGNSNDIFFH